MSFKRVGACNQCGDCCKPPIMEHLSMLDDDKNQCKYLREDLSRSGEANFNCPIFAGELIQKDIPKEDWEYFVNNCIDYPNPDDLGHREPEHSLSSNCSFNIEEVE